MLEFWVEIILLFPRRLLQRRSRFTIPIPFLSYWAIVTRLWYSISSCIAKINCLICWFDVSSLTLSSLVEGAFTQVMSFFKIWKFVDKWFGLGKGIEVVCWLSGRADVSNNWRIVFYIWWCFGTEQSGIKTIKLLSLLSLTLPISAAFGCSRTLNRASNANSTREDRAYSFRSHASENSLLALEFFFLFSSKKLENLSFHPRLVVTWLSGSRSFTLIEVFPNHIYFINHGIKFRIILIIFLQGYLLSQLDFFCHTGVDINGFISHGA